MDEALVQDAQDHVDDQDAHDQQEPQALHGRLEGLGRALEVGGDGGRQHLPGQVLHRGHRIPQGRPGFQVEGDGHRGQLPRMVDGEGPQGLGKIRQRIQRHQLAAIGPHVQPLQGRGVHLIPGLQLHDDLILIIRGVDGGDLPGAVGIVEGVLDLLGRDPQGGRLVPVDQHVHLGVLDLEVAVHVHQPRQGPHLFLEQGGILIEFVDVRALQGELVEALGQHAADADGGQVLRIDPDARDRGQLGPATAG